MCVRMCTRAFVVALLCASHSHCASAFFFPSCMNHYPPPSSSYQHFKFCRLAQESAARVCGTGSRRLRFFAHAQPHTFLARDNAVVCLQPIVCVCVCALVRRLVYVCVCARAWSVQACVCAHGVRRACVCVRECMFTFLLGCLRTSLCASFVSLADTSPRVLVAPLLLVLCTNVQKFLRWCRELGMPDVLLFESNDMVEGATARVMCVCVMCACV